MDSPRTVAPATEPRALTSDQKKAADAAFRGLSCDPTWPATARAVYDGLVTALQGKTVPELTHETVPSEPHYTLCYGMRLDKGTAPEGTHRQVSVTLPDGVEGSMALHFINGTPNEIRDRLLERLDGFFEFIPKPEPYHP
jgi:hypothetical protein